MDCSLPGSSIPGILQAGILEWVAISFSRRSSQPRDRTWVSRIAGRRFTIWTRDFPSGWGGKASYPWAGKIPWRKWKWSRSVVSDSCPTSRVLPGSSIPGILQAGILEWVAISFSRGSSPPRDRTHVSRIAGRHFNLWATREALRKWQSAPDYCLENPMDRRA